MIPNLEALLRRVQIGAAVPGVAVGLSAQGRRLTAHSGLADLQRQWGFQDTSRFGLGCLTKLLTAITAHLLHAQGAIDLQAPIEAVLPDLSHDRRKPDVTLEDLLSHTGGYQGPLMFGVNQRAMEWESFSRDFARAEQIFRPGSVFNYENVGHVILGEAVRRVTGKSMLDHIRTEVLAPLGIDPGSAAGDYRDPTRYVGAHQFDGEGRPRALPPVPFGTFWGPSLANWTLSLGDLLSLGEALALGRGPEPFAAVRQVLTRRRISLPICVSHRYREHNPVHFTALCAEYADGWFGYAGSASGQTCALRFHPASGRVCIAALNIWAPVARDALMDQLCGVRTHPEAGQPTEAIAGMTIESLAGQYRGGGNLIRALEVDVRPDRVRLILGREGLQSPDLEFSIDADRRLAAMAQGPMPGVGFFADPASGVPCVMVGVSTLRRIH
jgi:CubicO group peptidase (beta-lactamase class C family)